ncbi:Sialic acid-binding Ig-like lectin 5 [Galemys pyrenaicus]|uniref:Sialic acid-binding Ig-like lectin 5 n=1 Tax=Galemys pyrenaicus TaxID=202257 RepID=A0A8J5ZXG2_GALPY|nr:Sialic acid-binding Ig-like lectin 5 [Galemys pyrenaicus]
MLRVRLSAVSPSPMGSAPASPFASGCGGTCSFLVSGCANVCAHASRPLKQRQSPSSITMSMSMSISIIIIIIIMDRPLPHGSRSLPTPGSRQTSWPEGLSEPKPTPAADPEEPQELHYASLSFHGAKAREPQDAEASETTEYSEIRTSP